MEKSEWKEKYIEGMTYMLGDIELAEQSFDGIDFKEILEDE